jgi:apolipoprotein N-acyltransferase
MLRNILYLLPVCSAVLLTLAFPPFDVGLVAWIGLAPLLFALRKKGIIHSACLGWIFGLCFSACTFHWHVTAANLTDFFIFSLFFSLYFSLFGFFYRLVSPGLGAWMILGAPALWVAVEYLRSDLFFLAWPMNLLGHSQYQTLPIIQVADLTGVYGISFLLVMANQGLGELLDFFAARSARMPTVGTASYPGKTLAIQLLVISGAVAGVFLYGLEHTKTGEHAVLIEQRHSHLASPIKGDEALSSSHPLVGKAGGVGIETLRHIRVALIQANVVARNQMPMKDQEQHLRAYLVLTGNVAKLKPELIVWPSSSLPASIVGSRLVKYTIEGLARGTGAHLLVGGAGYEKMKPNKERHVPFANSEFLVSPTGRIVGQYNKMHLVPFNEYLPLGGKIPWPEWLTTVRESFLAGTVYTLFQVGEARFGTPICWENMFPDFFRQFVKGGANLMVSVANEGFMGPTAGPYQSLATNVFRAVENRVAIVRSTTTGVSAFIDPDGEIVERVRDKEGKDLLVAGFLVLDVPLSDKKTFYTLHGDVFASCVSAFAVLIILITLRSWRSSQTRFLNGP